MAAIALATQIHGSDEAGIEKATPQNQPVAAVTVLIVDDSIIDRRIATRVVEQRPGCKAVCVTSGAEALKAMGLSLPRIVLTDLHMPDMDGLALVGEIRKKYPQVPVILMTAGGSEEIAILALKEGAASYVPKHCLALDLPGTLDQVLTASAGDGRRRRVLASLIQRESKFILENDPALIPPLVAPLQEELQAFQLCDDTGATRAGIALTEVLLNALYHGNLELSSDQRHRDPEEFRRLVELRRKSVPFSNRRIRVFATATPAEAVYIIVDDGPGFDASQLLDPSDPANLEKAGRGLMLIRTFMDQVTYTKTGNQVTMVKRREQRREPLPRSIAARG